jgi:hypothetical protein
MARWGLLLMLALAIWSAVSLSVPADDPPIGAGGLPSNLDYLGQLNMGLKARRPVEFDYLQQVVALVDQGELPKTLVDTTFVWAYKKPTRRRLQYFQFALRARANQLGYPTPDLSNQAVGSEIPQQAASSNGQ